MDGYEDRFQFRKCLCRAVAFLDGFLCNLYFFCTSHISRIFSGQGKLCQSKRVGTEGRSLAGWNQLVGGRNRIMDLRDNLQNQVLSKLRHCRPVFDVRSELDFYRRICHALAVEDTVLVNLLVEVVCRFGIRSGKLICCSQKSLVCCGCGDGTCIHQGNGRNLSVLDFGSLAVREVSGGVTD